MPGQLESNFGAELFPTPSGKESGPTGMTAVATPALLAPATPCENVGLSTRGPSWVGDTDSARPASMDSVFDGNSLGFENMDSGNGGGGATNGALDTPWTGDIWAKP